MVTGMVTLVLSVMDVLAVMLEGNIRENGCEDESTVVALQRHCCIARDVIVLERRI